MFYHNVSIGLLSFAVMSYLQSALALALVCLPACIRLQENTEGEGAKMESRTRLCNGINSVAVREGVRMEWSHLLGD